MTALAVLDEIELEDEVENDAYPFSIIPDWVSLAPINNLAYRIYGLLRAYANKDKGGNSAFPGQDKLAGICGLAKTQAVSAAIRQLEAIGAVTRRMVRTTRGRKTIYRTYLEPHAGVAYDGPRMTSQLGDDEAFAELAAARARRVRGPRDRAPEAPDVQVTQELPEVPETPETPEGPEPPERTGTRGPEPSPRAGVSHGRHVLARRAAAAEEGKRLGWPYDLPDPLPDGTRETVDRRPP